MFEAVKKLRYETIAIKDTRVGDEKIPVRSIVERDYSINLLHLNKYVKGGIGADKKWAHAAQKLNFLLTAQKAKDLGIDPRIVHDSYAMSEIAEKIDMGKTPTSKSNLLRTLQTVITAMLGEGVKATSHDVNFLMSIYSRKNRRALTVTCANHSHFVGYLAEICNHIVTGASYELDFRRK